jgi:tetratricopeptide (TPR) repeat protein
MKRTTPLWLAAVVLTSAAHAAEPRLEIAPPNADWLLPATSLPDSCGVGLDRIEGCAPQVMPEGTVAVGERALAYDLMPLLAAGDYEAVLARVRVNRIELDLIEAGDAAGFRATRTPTDGSFEWAVPPTTLSVIRRAQAEINNPAIEDGTAPRSPRPEPARNPFQTRSPTGQHADVISASLLYVIGHSYFSLQRYVAAETAFKLALVAIPSHVRAHESLGMLYLQAQRYDDAREHLARAVELGRKTAHVYTALGYLELETRHYVAAASAFERTLALEPANRSAQRGLLLALKEMRDHTKGRALVEQLLRAEPNDRELWLYRAQIELEANDHAAALASLETAMRLGDDSADNRRALGTLHLETGNVARAVELLQGPAARGLAFPLVDRMLGWLADAGRWDDFRALLRSVDRAELGGAEQSLLLTRRAALALYDGNRRAASAALEEALTLDPSNATALVTLGTIYRAERDYGRAELVLRRASDYPELRTNALIARADIAIAQEDFGGALELLRNVVAGNPARSDVRRSIDVLEDLVLLRTQR